MYSRLESYIAELDSKLRAAPAERRESDVAEIRQHLESLVQAYLELGHTSDEAVALAIERFGSSKMVASRLLKVARGLDSRQMGARLFYAGWSLFLISLSLPTIRVLTGLVPGYACALLVLCYIPLVSPGSPALWYYHWLGFANLLILASPMLFALTKSRRQAWVVPTALGLAAASITPLLAGSEWHIGFYAWFLSFVLTAAGSSIRVRSARKERLAAMTAS